MVRGRLGIWIATLGVAFGCAPHPGRILVVVETDLGVPSELHAIMATVQSADGSVQERTFPIADRIAPPHEDPAGIPLSFAVVPKQGSLSAMIEVRGLSPSDDVRVTVALP